MAATCKVSSVYSQGDDGLLRGNEKGRTRSKNSKEQKRQVPLREPGEEGAKDVATFASFSTYVGRG